MRRPFVITLVLLFGMSSLGHVFAAAFCPRMEGRACCLAKRKSTHSCSHDQAAMKGMEMDNVSMDDMKADTMPADSCSEKLARDDGPAQTFEGPQDFCLHCLSHSGVINAPASFVFVTNQSIEAVPVAGTVPSFLNSSSAICLPQGLPEPHAPPGTGASRHLLHNVFLI